MGPWEIVLLIKSVANSRLFSNLNQLDTLLSLTDSAYKESEVVAAERLLSKTLNFEVNIPTCQVFLDRYMKAVETVMDGDSAKKVSTNIEGGWGVLGGCFLLNYFNILIILLFNLM